MKKLISLIMSFVMLLSITMGMNLSVFADEGEKTIVSAKLIPIKPYIIYEGAYGGYYENGDGYYWSPNFNDGDVIDVVFSDGTRDKYTYYAGYEADEWRNSEYDTIYVSRYGFSVSGTGKFYIAGYCIQNYNYDIENVPVTILENPVKSFDFVPMESYKIIAENENFGYYDEDEKMWYYYPPTFNVGDKISLNYKNGKIETFTYGVGPEYGCQGYLNDFVNEKGEVLDVGGSGFYYNGVGETTFNVELPAYGKTTDVPVTIIENPIESFSLVPIKPYEVIEKTNGDYDEEDGITWYYYSPEFNEGDKITVKYTNGKSEDFVFRKDDVCGFVNAKNEILNVDSHNFSFNGIGETTFKVKLSDYGNTIDAPITIIENPIDSISFDPVEPYEIYENSHGSYDDENNWSYDAPEFNDGDKITLKYKNGTSEEFIYKLGNVWNFVNAENEVLYASSHSFSFEGIGNTSFKLELINYNKSVNVPVTIIENPIDSFTFTPIKEYEVIENSGEVDGDDCYYDAPNFNDGDKITIKYKNGNFEEFVYIKDSNNFFNDKDEALDVYGHEFCYTGSGKTTFKVELPDYGKEQLVPVSIVAKPSGGSTGGGSIGGGGFVPAPAPEDTDKKDDDKKPETKPSETTPAPSTSKKPATVTASKPQAKQEAVVVTWKPAKDVDGYEVQVATDKKFKKNKKSVKVNKKKAKKKTVKNLKKNKKYYVRVRSYKIVNSKKVYGKWSKVKSVKTK